MERSLFYLETLLRDELRCIQSLTRLSLREQKILNKGKTDKILSLIQKKKTLIQQLRGLRTEIVQVRYHLIDKFVSSPKKPKALPVVQCESLFLDVNKSLTRLAAINRTNSILIRQIKGKTRLRVDSTPSSKRPGLLPRRLLRDVLIVRRKRITRLLPI